MGTATGPDLGEGALFGRFELAARRRPVDLVSPLGPRVDTEPTRSAAEHPLPQPAPYAAVVAELGPGTARCEVWLGSGRVRATAVLHGERTGLRLGDAAGSVMLRSRRHGHLGERPAALALTLTGHHVTVLTRQVGDAADVWTARARADLTRDLPGAADPRDERWLAGLRTGHLGRGVTRVRAGGFGQLGLRDLRLVSDADGSPYHPPGAGTGEVWLTATSAGPGFFDTAHTSVWALDTDLLTLEHRADLFFRRPGRDGRTRVYGDHATHLLRDGDSWLAATSTWGDFDRRHRDASVSVTRSRTTLDLLEGRHVLDSSPLRLPGGLAGGPRSVGVWDPHLVRPSPEGGWLVGYVSARKFFDFHPVVAAGVDLDSLEVIGADVSRRATEGTTLVRLDARWRVLASDGRQGRLSRRGAAYPVFDTELHQIGRLDAPYPTNLPWPTLVPLGATAGGGRLLVAFDARPAGGPLLGYGTHGDVVLFRSRGVSGAD